jgi:hypothetical protein
MEPRLDLHGNTVATRFAKYLVSANKALTDSALPAATQELVKLRAARSTAAPYAPICTPRTPRTPAKPSCG